MPTKKKELVEGATLRAYRGPGATRLQSMDDEEMMRIWDHALAVIRRKLDENWIEQRSQGGRTFDYITATKAIELMNEAFGPMNWSSKNVKYDTIQSTDKNGNDVWMFLATIEVEVPGRVVMGSGTNSARFLQIDTAYKGAMSDAFKKALTNLGFFMELYPDSTDNPEVWLQENKTSGVLNVIADYAKKMEADVSELAAEWSIERWGNPIYYKKDHVIHMHPDYAADFINWLANK